MRVRFNRRRVRAVRWVGPVAFEAERIRGLDQVCIVLGAVNIVATEAAHPMRIDRALNKVVSLYSVFVRRPVREMREGLLTELVLFKLPKVFQVQAHSKSDWPVIIVSVDRSFERLPLRVPLDANIRSLDRIEARQVDRSPHRPQR